MATILSLLKKIEALDTDKIAVDSISDSKEQLEEKNKEQIYSGEKKDGTEIIPTYRPLTIFLKQQKGQPTDRVTLFDTGSFYNGMYVNVSSSGVTIDSTDQKTKQLQEKYTDKIFGLNDKFRIEYIKNSLSPVFKSKMEAATGLQFK